MRQLMALALLLTPAITLAQTAQMPRVKNAEGQSVPVTPVGCVNLDGTACSFGGGAAGDPSSTQTADQAPTNGKATVVAGWDGTFTRRVLTDALGRAFALDTCVVVTGDPTYSIGAVQQCTMTPNGRTRVSVSYATNVTPAAIPATTVNSALVACQYRASPLTWQDTWTGSLRCDQNGRVAAVLEQPLPAGTNAIGSITNTGFAATVANGADVAEGNTGDLAWTGSGPASLIALGKAGYAALLAATPAAVTTAAPTYAAGTTQPLSLTTAGALRVDGSGATQPVSGTVSISGATYNADNADALAAATTSVNQRVVNRAYVFNGTTWDRSRGTVNGTATIMGLDPTATGGAASTTSYATTGVSSKASAGNVASVSLVTGTSSGYLIGANLTAVPASGTAITAAQNEYCMPVAASVGFDKAFPVPLYFTAGITWLFSTSCTTYTPVANAPIQITVQFK